MQTPRWFSVPLMLGFCIATSWPDDWGRMKDGALVQVRDDLTGYEVSLADDWRQGAAVVGYLNQGEVWRVVGFEPGPCGGWYRVATERRKAGWVDARLIEEAQIEMQGSGAIALVERLQVVAKGPG